MVDHTVRIAFEAPAAEALRGRVAAVMNRCDAVVALIGSGVRLDDWVAWEMREAMRRDLPLVALLLPTARLSGGVPSDLAKVPLLRGTLTAAVSAVSRAASRDEQDPSPPHHQARHAARTPGRMQE